MNHTPYAAERWRHSLQDSSDGERPKFALRFGPGSAELIAFESMFSIRLPMPGVSARLVCSDAMSGRLMSRIAQARPRQTAASYDLVAEEGPNPHARRRRILGPRRPHGASR